MLARVCIGNSYRSAAFKAVALNACTVNALPQAVPKALKGLIGQLALPFLRAYPYLLMTRKS